MVPNGENSLRRRSSSRPSSRFFTYRLTPFFTENNAFKQLRQYKNLMALSLIMLLRYVKPKNDSSTTEWANRPGIWSCDPVSSVQIYAWAHSGVPLSSVRGQHTPVCRSVLCHSCHPQPEKKKAIEWRGKLNRTWERRTDKHPSWFPSNDFNTLKWVMFPMWS